jgi:DNA-binding XRE family transcriptional regulator
VAIGDRIKQLRTILKMDQITFSKPLGINQGSLSVVEVGKSKGLSTKVKKALQKAYNVNIDWILTGNGEMFNGPVKLQEPQEKYGDDPCVTILQKHIVDLEKTIEGLRSERDKLQVQVSDLIDVIKNLSSSPKTEKLKELT